MKGIWLTIYIILTFVLTSCIGDPSPEGGARAQTPPEPEKKDEPRQTNKYPEIRYKLTHIKTARDLANIYAKYSADEGGWRRHILKTLNRKEWHYIRVGGSIVEPDSLIDDARAYSVFPQDYPAAREIKKLIIVSAAMQAYGCYENGTLVRFAAASTGAERAQTYPGKYSLIFRRKKAKSSLNEKWVLPYVWNFHECAGNAFHQFPLPGRPASHSCVRQFMEDAKWLFYWGEGWGADSSGRTIPHSGTPVIIIDAFDFSRPRGGPWLDLASNRQGIVSLPEDPMKVEPPFIPLSQVPKKSRGAVQNNPRYIYAEDSLKARGILRPHVRPRVSVDYNALRAARKRAAEQRLKADSLKS